MYSRLTTPQQNIWNLQKYYADSAISNICGAIFYDTRLRTDILSQAINKEIELQTGLRLQFCEIDGKPAQYVADYTYQDIPVRVFNTKEDYAVFANDFARQPVKLTGGKMYEFCIVEVEGRSGFIVKASHLISDAWSFSLFAHEITSFYNTLATGEQIPENDFSYIDYIETEKQYLKSEKYANDRKFWAEKYPAMPEKSIIKYSVSPISKLSSDRFSCQLSEADTKSIDDFCSESGISQAVLFESAIMAYLARINEENTSVTIGIPVLNRSTKKEKSTVGMYISTMPLTVPVSRQMTAAELCEEITSAHREIFRHQKYPYQNILQMIREKYNFSGSLFDVMVSYQNAKTEASGKTEWYSNGYSETPLELHIDNRDSTSHYTVTVDYQTELFSSSAEIELLVNRIVGIIRQVISAPDMTVVQLDILTESEKQKVIYDFNDTAVDYPRDKCVHELFSEQVAKTPDKVALIFEDKQFMYKQLDEMSNSLAHYLREKGVKPNDIVPIISQRSYLAVVAMFAVLKAGGAYMPVDPAYPKDRIDYMINDAGSSIALTCGYNEPLAVETIVLDGFDFSINCTPIKNVNTPDDLCYLIFTSGSTGKPKGAMLKHSGVINFANCRNPFVKAVFANCNIILAIGAFTFDISVVEIYIPLLNGLCTVVANEESINNPDLLAHIILINSVDFVHATPTRLSYYLNSNSFESAICNIKTILTAGESFTPDLLEKIRKSTNAIIYNGYGPTETTVGCSFAIIEKADNITIGKPIANTQIYILDKNRKPLPIGVAGELCISGEGVGKGYLNRPELTAEKFIPNPFIDGKTMYCTGDLARWLEDGEIEYLGRIDTQVKIRGLRIELGEIESVMSSFDGIHMTAATDKRDENGRQYLVGYYTADSDIDEKALRRHLSAKLPKYMVPNYFVHLDEMPMTASGKTDRKNLPLPEFTASNEEYVAPETETEITVAAIWSRLLKTDRIGKDSDFFDLGGDSLMVISLLAELESSFNTQLSMKDIMENPVLEKMAVLIDKADKKALTIKRINSDKYVLLPQQKAIYAACQKEAGSLAYNMPGRIALPQDIDREKIKDCFNRILELHPSLKTRIVSEENELYGIIDYNAKIHFEDYSEGDYLKFVRPFDLSTAPLIRVAFTETAMLFDMHHIIGDGESLSVILRDFAELYNGRKAVPSDVEYSDYSHYFYNADFSAHREYFRNMLKCDFEPVVLPEKKHITHPVGVSKIYSITGNTFGDIREYAHKNGLSDTMVFLGAFGILLSKYTAKTDILSSIVLTNRTHAETKNTVGMFVNTLPVMMSAEGSTAEYYASIRNLVLDLYQYQELPMLEIADAVNMTDKTVVNTSFVYQAGGSKNLIANGQTLTPKFIDTHTAKFDVTFEVTPSEDCCSVRIEYNSGKYDEALIDRLFKGYVMILEQLHTERISDISVMDKDEYRKVIYDFNDTAVDYPRDKCVHELFSEQAARTPDKVALVFEDKQFTYKQLDEMSNSLAHYLHTNGITKGDVIGVLLNRSEKVIVAQLASLKLGCAFLPIDSRYPTQRVQDLIGNCKVSVLLVEDGIPANDYLVLKINIADGILGNTERIVSESDFEDICYIIYTSGSTGKPKGCCLTYCGITNFCKNNNLIPYIKKLSNQIVVSVNTISFDYFIAESLFPLSNGYTVVLANEYQSDFKEAFKSLVIKNRANIVMTTPTRLKLYTENEDKAGYFNNINIIVSSGEALSKDLLSRLNDISCAQIFNPLGPSECSVWNVDGNFIGDDITIGKPIANTQIYILDKNRKPLPIGVAGELCISGDGVGKGYLNRPELTAEKFIPNPFIDGKTMYCTGDLARWLEDGEIEYLGRIDTQVKIRGLRIELGEIESVMSSFDGIHMTAATDKRDENGRQYLVGYYTADSDIDEKALRRHLSAKLPKYMVPNYFVHLNEMPMTASGKTDRKNLPLPEFTASNEEYVAPETDFEKRLCNVLCEMFSVEKAGVTDDFFNDLGGDSLKAIEYVAKAHTIGVEFALQEVFDYPTVRSLCSHLEKGSEKIIRYTAGDFEKFNSILGRNVIDESFVPVKKELGNVLLTGATGFLGAHILDSLMQNETGKIYCLVRSNSPDDRRGRWPQMLQYYFGNKYDGELGKRIIPVVGDITRDGLSDNAPTDVQTVIHTAATVKHFGSYEYFRSVNVEGTQNVINYASRIGTKLIHISTISVSGNSLADEFAVYRSEELKNFYETSLFIGQPLDNVYVRSKFEAEVEVLEAIRNGINAKIIRVGNLTNRLSDSRFQPNYKSNAFLTRFKAALDLGMVPDYLLPIYAEFSPIDQTADGVIKIAQYADDQCVFHLNSNRPIYFDRLVEVLNQLGYRMDVVSGEKFNRTLQNLAKNSKTEYIYEAFQNDMNENGELVYDSNIRIRNDFTDWFMKKVGFEWAQIDFDYIKGYLEYFRNLGYFEVRNEE